MGIFSEGTNSCINNIVAKSILRYLVKNNGIFDAMHISQPSVTSTNTNITKQLISILKETAFCVSILQGVEGEMGHQGPVGPPGPQVSTAPETTHTVTYYVTHARSVL